MKIPPSTWALMCILLYSLGEIQCAPQKKATATLKKLESLLPTLPEKPKTPAPKNQASEPIPQTPVGSPPAPRWEPVKLPTTMRALDVHAGHICSLSPKQRVFCWGSQAEGQLGPLSSSGPSSSPLVSSALAKSSLAQNLFFPTPQSFEPTIPLKSIALSKHRSCGLGESQILCWGQGISGFESINGQFADLIAGDHYFCALSHSGEATCWGDNTWGQLGLGHTNPTSGMQPLSGTSSDTPPLRFQSLSAGARHVCGVHLNQQLFCWGANTTQQVHEDQATLVTTPTLIVLRDLVKAVALGTAHTCAWLEASAMPEERVICWGHKGLGQGGFGPEATSGHPSEPVPLLPSPITKLSAGGSVTCAVGGQDSTEVACWGSNMFHQINSDTKAVLPVTNIALPPHESWIFIKPHRYVTLAMTKNGQVFIWGSPLGRLYPQILLKEPISY